MTTPKYRLPVSLGGGECEIVADSTDGVFVWTTVDGVVVKLDLPRSLLVAVEPALPEPPVGSVVLVDAPDDGQRRAWQRDDWGPRTDFESEQRWYQVGGHLPTSWGTLIEANPVLLVPDPAAGAATSGEWRCLNYKDDALEVELVEGESRVEVRTNGWVYLSPDDAESAGLTMIAAARAARQS